MQPDIIAVRIMNAVASYDLRETDDRVRLDTYVRKLASDGCPNSIRFWMSILNSAEDWSSANFPDFADGDLDLLASPGFRRLFGYPRVSRGSSELSIVVLFVEFLEYYASYSHASSAVSVVCPKVCLPNPRPRMFQVQDPILREVYRGLEEMHWERHKAAFRADAAGLREVLSGATLNVEEQLRKMFPPPADIVGVGSDPDSGSDVVHDDG